MAVDDRSEQTPEGEGGMAATKTARKLQLEDDNDDDDVVIVNREEREDGQTCLPSSSASASSPLHRSPFRKSPQTAAASSHLQTDSEISVRKRLFPSNSSSERLSKFQFSGSKRPLSSAINGGKNPFALLDESQKFTGGVDSENKKYFVLTNNAEDTDISSQENSILPQTDSVEIQDTDNPSQNSTGEATGVGRVEAKNSSFSYMTSKDFITAHPCTHGQPNVDGNPPVLQRSLSVAEMMIQPARARATSSHPLIGSDGNRSRRGSTSSTKVCYPKI